MYGCLTEVRWSAHPDQSPGPRLDGWRPHALSEGGRSSGEEEKIIVALEATLARLEQQVTATRDQLTAMERS